MFRISWIFLTTAFLSPLAYAGDAACSLKHYAFVDMETNTADVPVVSVTIGGKPIRMLVATGGIVSKLSPRIEDVLGLARRKLPSSRLEVYGGERILSYVHIPDMTLGPVKLPRLVLYTFPDDSVQQNIDGVIGSDILSAFDVEFDFAKGKLGFFSQDHCPGQVVYWTHDGPARIPIQITSRNQILLTIQLDGQSVLAMIDTGSDKSQMSLEAAERLFGFDTTSPLLKRDPSVGKYAHYHYPFKNLSMQGVSVSNPDLTLISNDESGFARSMWEIDNATPRIILGMNILRHLHIYIAYREKAIYVTPAEAH